MPFSGEKNPSEVVAQPGSQLRFETQRSTSISALLMPSRFRKAARVAKFGVLPSFVLVGLGGCGLTPSVNATRVPSEVPVQAPAPTGPDVGGSAPKLAWARTDKRLISGNPELTAQAQADIAECYAVSPPVRTAAGVPGEPCMEKRGYYVREL
jgi:hypothetical protein